MGLIIPLIILSFCITNIQSQDEWTIKDATSVICLSNEEKLNQYIISANKYNLMLRRNNVKGGYLNQIFPFENKFEDLNINAVIGRFELELILVFYEKYMQVINENNLISQKFEVEPGYFRNTLKNMNTSFVYISTDYNIVKIDVEVKGENAYEIKKESRKIFDGSLVINSISCDVSKDDIFYICSYFNGGKLEISLFSVDLSLLDKKSYATGVSNPNNFFNKIIFLKDNYKFISINAENNLEIRLRYLEIKDNAINVIKLHKEKGKEVEYLDIKGTLSNSSYLYNDLVSLDNDEIFKVYMNSKSFILTKIQFYDNNILTVKTKRYDNMVDKASNVHLTKRSNGMVFDFNNGNNYQFLQIGHVQSISTNYITTNDNFQITQYKIESILKTKLIAEIESIPENFALLSSQEYSFLSKGSIIYPENDIYQLSSYKKNDIMDLLYFQTKLIYEFPSDGQIEIFPSDETTYPPETKIISLGNQGNITFRITSCSKNYYPIENEDICTILRPEGYYFDNDQKIFKKCHNNCAECLIYSNDDSNMQCLKCKSGFMYNPNTFNCFSLDSVTPKTISIELINNEFFWVFLVIIILAIIIAVFIIWQNTFFKKCKKKGLYLEIGLDEEKNELKEIENKDNDLGSSNSKKGIN